MRRTGAAGRITSYSETDDGRYLITLTGVCRFAVVHELDTDRAYRRCAVEFGGFVADLNAGTGEDDVDRSHLLKVLKTYLDANELKADWQSIHRSSNEFLVNTLSMISPYGPEEKQALLEAAVAQGSCRGAGGARRDATRRPRRRFRLGVRSRQ